MTAVTHFYSNSKRTGNWAQRGYYRSTCGRVHNSYCNRSVERGQNCTVSGSSSRIAYSGSNDKVVTKDIPEDKQGHKSSAECGNVADLQCQQL
jgi:hypothetical protein